MGQTSISTTFTRGYAGQIVYPGQLNEIVSRQVDDADGIADGLFVAKGTADHEVKAPVAATDVTGNANGGVIVRNPSREPGVNADDSGVSCMLRGYVLCHAAAGAYTKGQAVNVRYDGTGTFGSLTQAAVSSETAIAPNCQIFETLTLSVAGLILVKVGAN